MPTDSPVLVVSPGEPAGIGWEIAAKAWAALRHEPVAFAMVADEAQLRQRCAAAGLAIAVQSVATLAEAPQVFATALPVLHRPLAVAARAGQLQAETAPWVIACLREAVSLCLSGAAAGLVTCPIQKEALYGAGFAFQGHTDFLAALAREAGQPATDVMMLVGGGLRAVPVTVHIALKDVPAALTQQAIVDQARVVHAALQRQFGIAAPRVAVTGLNPHAGEGGSMGREEIDVIIPAIRQLQAEGLGVFGPVPGDTAFYPQARAGYDAILCMYHDQALIPVKTLDFHGGVNVTLGLPFVRTSPDHGTALDLAGTGKADASSMIAALRLAGHMAKPSAT